MKKILIFTISFLLILNEGYSQNDDCNNLDEISRIITIDENPETPIITLEPIEYPSDPPIYPQEEIEDRFVFWIHGFGGDEYALVKAQNISTDPVPHPNGGPSVNERINYNARKIKSFAPSYGTGLDLVTYGIEIGNEINLWSEIFQQTETEAQRNFAITSSWGGNVTRMAAVQKNSPGNSGLSLGGIVSMGGSHIGAELADNIITTVSDTEFAANTEFQIFNNTNTGDLRATVALDNFLIELDQSLLAGPICDIFDDSFILSLLGTSEFGMQLTSLVQGLIDELVTIIPSTLNQSLFSRTALNLQTTNSQQVQLNNSSIPTTNVAAYAVEEMELGLWRLFYWGKNSPNNMSVDLDTWTADGQGYFQADSDEFAVQTYSRNLANYQMRENMVLTEINSVENTLMRCEDIFYLAYHIEECIDASAKIDALYKTRMGFLRGISWFQNSSDYWHLLTGALSFETVPSQNGTCTCNDGSIPPSFPCNVSNLSNYECDELISFTPGTEIIEVRKESDAVVLAESASAFPGAVHVFRMDGSNHFNLRNDSNTQFVLKNVFDGVEELNLMFFETPKKEF